MTRSDLTDLTAAARKILHEYGLTSNPSTGERPWEQPGRPERRHAVRRHLGARPHGASSWTFREAPALERVFLEAGRRREAADSDRPGERM